MATNPDAQMLQQALQNFQQRRMQSRQMDRAEEQADLNRSADTQRQAAGMLSQGMAANDAAARQNDAQSAAASLAAENMAGHQAMNHEALGAHAALAHEGWARGDANDARQRESSIEDDSLHRGRFLEDRQHNEDWLLKYNEALAKRAQDLKRGVPGGHKGGGTSSKNVAALKAAVEAKKAEINNIAGPFIARARTLRPYQAEEALQNRTEHQKAISGQMEELRTLEAALRQAAGIETVTPGGEAANTAGGAKPSPW